MKGPKIPIFIRPVVSAVADRMYATFVQPNMKKHLAFLELLLETAPNGGPYLCGEHFTAADILLTYPLATAKKRLPGLEGAKGNWTDSYPKVWGYVERLEQQEGYKRAVDKIEKLRSLKGPNQEISPRRTQKVPQHDQHVSNHLQAKQR